MADENERKQKKKVRADGEGSIYKRPNGKWSGSISLGYGIDSKRQRRTVYGGTRQEVVDKLNKLKQEVATGKPVENSKITVSEHFSNWLKESKLQIRHSTWSKNEAHVRNHITPFLGHITLSKLSYKNITSFYLYLQEETELAQRTIYDVATVLKAGLKDAVNKQIIHASPADKIAKPKKGEKEARFMDQSEVKKFLEAAKGERLENLFVLMLHTGLRPGEALGLSWDAVDYNKETLSANRALHEVNGKLYMGELKTKSSKRLIALSDTAIQALKSQKKKQIEEQLACGKNWHNQYNLIFTTLNGHMLSRTSVLRSDLYPILKKAGLKDITLHTFRHTHASLLIYQGADIKTISSRLGHSDITTTLQIYGHVLPGQDQRAAKMMDELLDEIK